MIAKNFSIIFLLCSTKLFAFLVGSPLDPSLYHEGVLFDHQGKLNLRTGYVNHYVYQGRYKDEFKTIDSTVSDNTLETSSAMIILNVLNRLDLYGILGFSKMQIDQVIFGKERFCWSAGAKAIFFETDLVCFGVDIKYFQTKVKPDYFLIDGLPMDLLTSFSLTYSEMQGSASLSYKSELLAPYIGVTYLFSKILPVPATGILEASTLDMKLDFEINNSINRKRWGLVIGTSILSTQKAALNLESRMFDQNAVNISGELRF